MKEKIAAILLLLFLTALLPFAAVKCSSESDSVNSGSTSDEDADSVIVSSDDNKLLCALVAAEYDENYDDETVKALAVILNTNYTVNPDSFDLNDTEQCIYENEADNSLKENYSHISEEVNSVTEITITYNNEKVYIPFSETSNGHTFINSEFEYLVSVASPWDCFENKYDENAECIGVSVSGIDYLCKNGYSFEDALKWYLPKCEIK